jgi:hypothetical protein
MLLVDYSATAGAVSGVGKKRPDPRGGLGEKKGPRADADRSWMRLKEGIRLPSSDALDSSDRSPIRTQEHPGPLSDYREQKNRRPIRKAAAARL